MSSTTFLSIRELRASTGRLKALLADDGKIVLTANGKPAALMLEVSDSSLEDLLLDLRQLQAMRALRTLQDNAQKNGTASMSLEEINKEIAAARKDRKG